MSKKIEVTITKPVRVGDIMLEAGDVIRIIPHANSKFDEDTIEHPNPYDQNPEMNDTSSTIEDAANEAVPRPDPDLPSDVRATQRNEKNKKAKKPVKEEFDDFEDEDDFIDGDEFIDDEDDFADEDDDFMYESKGKRRKVVESDDEEEDEEDEEEDDEEEKEKKEEARLVRKLASLRAKRESRKSKKSKR